MNITYDIEVGEEKVKITGTDQDSGMSISRYAFNRNTKYATYRYPPYISMDFIKEVIRKELTRRLTR